MNEFQKPVLIFYSLRSKVLEFFNVPFVSGSDVEAVALVRNAIGSGSIPMNQAEDLELWLVGQFNTSTGSFNTENLKIVDDFTIFARNPENML